MKSSKQCISKRRLTYFEAIFSYGENQSEGALENQLRFFLIFFPSFIQTAYFSQRSLNHLLFLDLNRQPAKQCTPTQNLMLLVLDLATGKIEIKEL